MKLKKWQEGVDYIANPPGCSNCNVPTIKGIEVVVARILQLAVSFALLVAFVFLIYGGFLWLIAGGDDQKIGQAKKTITYSLLGIVVLVGSMIILRAVEVITGVSLHTFRIYFAPTNP